MSRTTSRSGKHQTQSRFASVPGVEKPRSSFDRSYGRLTTFNAGDIVPILVDEALPGDTINLKMSSFCRFNTPIYPLMDNMYMDFFFFAVPYRLVWDNWQKFNGEQVDPGDSVDFLVPQITGTPVEKSLSDYFALPIGNSITFNSLHHRAYNLIWNEWFRDQNLQDSLVVDRDDGPDTLADYVLKKRCKRHDYMTSCLPWPQKGTAVSLPLGETAPLNVSEVPVVGEGDGVPSFTVHGSAKDIVFKDSDDGMFYGSSGSGAGDAVWADTSLEANLTGVLVDLSSATASTVNELRESFQIQRMLERDARGGSRYTEIVRSHFGVVSPDQRLQRPEYLGGGTSQINMNPVAATNIKDGVDLGTLGAFATQDIDGIGFVKSFEEHCLILGFVNVRAELTYQQNIPRMFSRQTRYDYYWPSLAHLGEQAVLNKEVYSDGSAADELVFGYQERWAEYRYKPSEVTGQMRSEAATPLDSWHLAIDFGGLPTLNDTFIQESPPIMRVVAVTTEPDFRGDFWFNLKMARCMPTHSVPGLIDHF